MTRLLVATRNRGKQREFAQLLAPAGFELVHPDQLGIAPSDAEDALECHDSFQSNAEAKARWFAGLSGCLTVADDSGLEVEALNGAPGVHSRRFAGASGPDEILTAANNVELLRRLHGVADPQRTARFRCVLAVVEPGIGATPLYFEGVTRGRILHTPAGLGGFGYDAVFWSEDLGVSFAEAAPADKHAVSHRGRAVARWLAARGGVPV